MIEAAKLEADIYPAGPRGLSAYEIYKKEGGQLSEEEWLKSLNGLTPTIGENGNWFLGTVDTGLPSRGPKGDTGSIKFIVVTELPTENIDETAIYMKPVEKPTGENKFEELIYVNGKWEDLGTPNVAVDLSNYYTKNDVDNKLSTISKVYYWEEGNKGEESIKVFQDMINDLINGGNPILSNKYSNDSSANADYRIGGSNIYTFPTDLDITTLSTYTGEIALRRFGYSSVGVTSGKVNRTWVRYKIIITLKNGTVTKIFGPSKLTAWFGDKPWEGGYETTILCAENTMAYTPTTDYNPATKKYVDDTISVKGGDKLHDYNIYTITLDNYNLKGTFPTITDTATLAKFDEILTDIYKKRIASNATHGNAFLIVYSSSDTFIFRISTIGSSYCNLYGTYVEQPIDHNGYTCSYTFSITGTLDTTAQTFKTTKVKFDNNSRRVLLTNNTLSYNPTSNYNPSTKLYTDKTHYENMTGYDATKTQVLKNINGTLTWVDEV